MLLTTGNAITVRLAIMDGITATVILCDCQRDADYRGDVALVS